MHGRKIVGLRPELVPVAPGTPPPERQTVHFDPRWTDDPAVAVTGIIAADSCASVERMTAQAAMYGRVTLIGVLPNRPQAIDAAVDLETNLLFVDGTGAAPEWVAALARFAPERRPMLLFLPGPSAFPASPDVEPGPDAAAGAAATQPDTLVVGDGKRVLIFGAEEVDWVRAEGKWSTISAGGGVYTVRRALGHLERQLDPRRFVRVHRSLIVRLGGVAALEPGFHGDYELLLKDGVRLPMSRRYVRHFFAATALG